MIKTIALGLLAHFVFGMMPGFAQQTPTCHNPVGSWADESHAVLHIVAFDSAGGEIKGTYRLSTAAELLPVSGRIGLFHPAAGDVTPIAIIAGGNVPGDIQSWTGYCRETEGVPTITVIGQMAGAGSSGEVVSSRAIFKPASEVEVAARMDSTRVISEAHIARASAGSCPMQGKNKQGNPPAAKLVALNLLKNRNSVPQGADLDAAVSLSQLLNSHDDANVFDEHQAATITGVLFDVRQEKGESCNCYSTDSKEWDFHIYIGNSNAKSIFDCAVVEMTPYSRAIHPEWTLDFVKGLKGKKVKVTGWLLYDFEHLGQSFETNPNTGAPNRHTVWELHPVTGISAQ
jgi:hypothetical protein